MNKKTRAALKGSIQKWTKIVKGTGVDNGTANCPLCQLFYFNYMEGCTGCPVKLKTGRSDCQETPYSKWSWLFRGDRPWKAETQNQKEAAQAELDFLKSLLPKKKNVKKS